MTEKVEVELDRTGPMFPEGTEIRVAGPPVQKPWGLVTFESFICETLGPLRVDAMISTLTGLWQAHNASSITLRFKGEQDDEGGRAGAFWMQFSPEFGFANVIGNCAEGGEVFRARLSPTLMPDQLSATLRARYQR